MWGRSGSLLTRTVRIFALMALLVALAALGPATRQGVVPGPDRAANRTMARLAAGPVQAADCTISEKLVSSCRPWLGAESGGYGVTGFRASMLEHEARIGRQLDVVHEYYGTGAVLTSDVVTLAQRPGTIALVNWKPASRWADADGRSTSVNAQIDAMADSIKALGSTKIMLAIFHEPENDISPGGDPSCPSTPFNGRAGTVAAYRAMWHNVRDRFDARGVDNVVWVMNYMGWKAWHCAVPGLWPGNDYVDWLTWDPYPKTATWTQFVNMFYNYLLANNDPAHDYLSKPWGLSEFGYVGSSQTAAYQMYDDIRSNLRNGVHPKLRLYSVWDQHTSSSHDDRVGYTEDGVRDPVEQQHYNAFANDPLMTGSGSTTEDTTAPTTPTELAASLSGSGVRLTWNPSTDDVGVAGYTVNRGGVPIGTALVPSYTDATAPPGQQVYTVTAFDAAGNRSEVSGSAGVTVPSTDVVDPSPPSGLTAVAGTRQITLGWNAASDNVGVARYYLFRDNLKYLSLGNVTGYTDTGLTAGRRYVYKVYAIDAAGNWSGPSNKAAATPR
jgi:hypothetical protein